jgi:hypothetical protein
VIDERLVMQRVPGRVQNFDTSSRQVDELTVSA